MGVMGKQETNCDMTFFYNSVQEKRLTESGSLKALGRENSLARTNSIRFIQQRISKILGLCSSNCRSDKVNGVGP